MTNHSVAREVVTFFTLPPGDYIVVPQTNVPNCDGKFLLRILTDEQSNIWEVNEDNMLFRNVTAEFEESFKYVSGVSKLWGLSFKIYSVAENIICHKCLSLTSVGIASVAIQVGEQVPAGDRRVVAAEDPPRPLEVVPAGAAEPRAVQEPRHAARLQHQRQGQPHGDTAPLAPAPLLEGEKDSMTIYESKGFIMVQCFTNRQSYTDAAFCPSK